MGGCYYITSRILIVDLLKKHINASRVVGMLIFDAHRIHEGSLEQFVVRVYRQLNETGFIKAFSEDAEHVLTNDTLSSLTMTAASTTVRSSNGYCSVEKLLKGLMIPKLHVYSRVHSSVSEWLCVPPLVLEKVVRMTPLMRAVQGAVLVALDTCLKEIKKSIPMIDLSEIRVETAIHRKLELLIQQQLEAESLWHKTSKKTKQLLEDIKTLRGVTENLVRYDSVTFYSYLMQMKAAMVLLQSQAPGASMNAVSLRFTTHAN